MSEIARLRRQIELECEAMKQALNGFMVTASHDIIHHRYDCIGDIQQQLISLVGEQEAARIAVEVYIQTIG
ncbi:MAG TPA: hypothetical protein VL461_09295 [Dictyobacter sp.]|nr:hypothetical protein [Dictyobacter sp.]